MFSFYGPENLGQSKPTGTVRGSLRIFVHLIKSTHANLKGLVRETPLNLFLDAELWWIFNYSLESRHLYDSLIL